MSAMDRKPDIVCISSIDWDFIWQGHQEIMSTLAAAGASRAVPREHRRSRAAACATCRACASACATGGGAPRGSAKSGRTCSSTRRWCCRCRISRVARWINRWLLMRALRRWMRRDRLLPADRLDVPADAAGARPAFVQLDPQLTIYYCIDDFASSSPGAQADRRERGAAVSATPIWCSSPRRRCAQRAARVQPRACTCFRSASTSTRFDAIRAALAAAPGRSRRGCRGRSSATSAACTSGSIRSWSPAVARRLPDVTFALVGPAQTDVVGAASACPTSALLGQRPHAELPRYVKAFDVGIVPYRLTEYTANVYPTKLNEYLVDGHSGGRDRSAGDPPLQRRARRHRAVAADADGVCRRRCVEALARLVARRTSRRRIEVAHANSWPSRIAVDAALIDEGDRAARARRSSAGTTRCGASIAARGATRRMGGARPAVAVYLLVFQTNLLWWCAEPLKRRTRRRAPPTRSSCSPAASASRGRPAAASRSALKQADRSVSRRLRAVSRVVVGVRLQLSRSGGDARAGARSGRAGIGDRARTSVPPTPTRTCGSSTTILRDHHWRRILLVSSPYHMRRALMVWREAGAGRRGRSRRRCRRASSTITAAARRSSRCAASFRSTWRSSATGGAGGSDAIAMAVELLTVTVPGAVIALFVAALIGEIWVRASWDARKGEPGFFLSDAARGQRLAAGYDGWFAGVPVHINSLELRDPREYALAKQPNTFRILCSATRSPSATARCTSTPIPYLLEQRLKAWRPDVDWQVWNAAVPGYNTSQELAHLLEVGDQSSRISSSSASSTTIWPTTGRSWRRRVSVAWRPGALGRAAPRLLARAVQEGLSHRRVDGPAPTTTGAASSTSAPRSRCSRSPTQSAAAEQLLTPFDRLTDDEVSRVKCVYGMKPNSRHGSGHRAHPGLPRMARRGPRLSATGPRRPLSHRVLRQRRAADLPRLTGDRLLLRRRIEGGRRASTCASWAPAPRLSSSYDAFLHVRPSQMPNAAGHSLGNANVVKADVLFGFLRESILPTLMPPAPAPSR